MSKTIPLYFPGMVTARQIAAKRVGKQISTRRTPPGGIGPSERNVPMSEQKFAEIAEDSHWLSGVYPELADLSGDLTAVTGRYLNATAPMTARHFADSAVNRGVRYGAKKIEQLTEKVVQHTMHEIVKRTRIAANIFAVDTLPDAIRAALKGDESSKSLLASLRIGNDDILTSFQTQLKRHGDDFSLWDIHERLAMRSAITRYVNNLTLAPSLSMTPGLFDTPLGRIFLQFKRFLWNAPQKHLPNAMKRGGVPAVIGSMMGVTAWGMMVEGAVKPYLKGRGVWDGWKRDLDTFTEQDWLLVGRIINSSGQFGYLPETIFSMRAFDPSRIPALYSMVRAYRAINKGIPNLDDPEGQAYVASGVASVVGLQTFADAIRWRRKFMEEAQKAKMEAFLDTSPVPER